MMRRIVFSLFLLILLAPSCIEEDHANPVKRDCLTIVQTSDIFTLDPHTFSETVTASLLNNIMEPLVKLDRNLNIDREGSLARGWTNPDDRTWRFHIRPGVRFHNGFALTAFDVKASIERAKNHPLTDIGGGLGNIASIVAEDDTTLCISMKEPSAILIPILSDCLIMPKEQAEKWKDDQIDETPVGTGPYTLASWERGETVELASFDDYWGGLPEFERVSVRAVKDPQARVDLITSGKADLVVDIPVEMVESVRKQQGVKVIAQEGLRVIYLGFDVGREESPFVSAVPNPFKDRRVREAIARAIDEEKIVREILQGYGRPATQFCAPGVFGFNPELDRIPFDPVRARELLAEAGYADGFSLTLHCPNNRYVQDEETGAMIAEHLRNIGLDVTFEPLPKEIFLPGVAERKYSLFLVGWDCPEGDASTVFVDCLHSMDGGEYGYFNAGDYRNEALDALIDSIETSMDPLERAQLLEEAQELGMRDIPWVPLHIEVNLYGVRDDLIFAPRLDKQVFLSEISRRRAA
jgi:peptide/nickel transport system substrate-binding protein